MKSAAKLGMAILTTVLMASELDPKLLRLIGPDTKAIYGIDVEQYRHSRLAAFFPMSLGGLSGGFNVDEAQIHQVITVIRGELDPGMQLIVFRGAPSPSQFQSSGGRASIVQTDRGGSMALLDSTTGIMGDADRVHETVGHWRLELGGSEEIAAKARQLSASYDNWFLALRPLEKLDRPRTSSVWKPENDLRSLVEEVRGGVRLGAFNEVSLDVVMKTAEDAAVLAGISRWLPGFIQLQESRSPQSALAALV